MYCRKEQNKTQEEQLSEVEIVKRIQSNDNEDQRSQKKTERIQWMYTKELENLKKI